MARIKAAVNAHKKRRKIMKLAKGYFGSKSKQYRAAKRFKLTKRGLVKRAKAYKRHILNKKTRKTKRNLRRTAYVSECYANTIKKLVPYM